MREFAEAVDRRVSRWGRRVIVYSFVVGVVLLGPLVLAQAAETATGATLTPNPTSSALNGFMWAYVGSWLMRWLREHPNISAFSSDTSLKVQRLFAAVFAFLQGIGITFVFDAQTGQLVISGLFASSIINGVRQFILQEFVYHSALKRPDPK